MLGIINKIVMDEDIKEFIRELQVAVYNVGGFCIVTGTTSFNMFSPFKIESSDWDVHINCMNPWMIQRVYKLTSKLATQFSNEHRIRLSYFDAPRYYIIQIDQYGNVIMDIAINKYAVQAYDEIIKIDGINYASPLAMYKSLVNALNDPEQHQRSIIRGKIDKYRYKIEILRGMLNGQYKMDLNVE